MLALAASIGLAGCDGRRRERGRRRARVAATGPVGPDRAHRPRGCHRSCASRWRRQVTIGNGSTLTAQQIADIGDAGRADRQRGDYAGAQAPVIEITVKTVARRSGARPGGDHLRVSCVAKLVPAGRRVRRRAGRATSTVQTAVAPACPTPVLASAVQANTETRRGRWMAGTRERASTATRTAVDLEHGHDADRGVVRAQP
ncbi:MAG: hypothetical protein MZV65_31325 [Chromatiales bacterium]|nr:hypothetical protein [Chromatiales bacterium]